VNAAEVFADLLKLRLCLLQHGYPDLALKGPAYRADPVFEAGADFADALALYENGAVGDSVVREGALKVAALAALVYFATVGRRRAAEEFSEDGC